LLMSREENIAQVHRYFDAINNDDMELLAQVVAADFLDHAPVSGLPPGLEGVKAAHLMLREAFPDVHFTVEDVIGNEDRIVVRATGRGTNKGSFFGMPATGKEISWPGFRLIRFEGGRMVEGWSIFDQLGILQQMGVIPMPGQPPPAKANEALKR